jgi:rhodanese-related sulfurtransferase
MIIQVEPKQLQRELESENPPQLLDVREADELEISSFAHFKHIPLGQVPERFGELDKDQDYVVTCRSGGRSGKACEFLAAQGYKVRNLNGGINRWAQEVDTSLPTY